MARVSDRPAAGTGSIPWCGKGFFSQSTFSADSLTCVRTPPCANACINICAHVNDPVVHFRVRWIMDTLKHRASTVGWVAQLCRSLLSPEKQPEFPMGKIPMGQYSCLKKSHSFYHSHKPNTCLHLALIISYVHQLVNIPQQTSHSQLIQVN